MAALNENPPPASPIDIEVAPAIANEEAIAVKDDSHQYLIGVRMYNLLAAIYLAIFLIGLDAAIVSTAVPTMTAYFKTIADINWYGSAYLLAICVVQPLAGKLYTFFPTKAVFLAFMAIFELGSLLCAISTSSRMFIGARAIAGVGGAGLTNGALVMILASSPPKLRPVITAFGISMLSIGSIAGPLIGGVLTQHVTWRWCFWIFLPSGGFTMLVIVFQRIPEQASKPSFRSTLPKLPQHLDLIGFGFFSMSCTMFLLAISWGGSAFSWDSSTVIGLLSGAFGMLCAYIAWALYRQDKALIPPGIVKRDIVAFGCAVVFLQGGASMMMSYYLPLWFQAVKGVTPTTSGVMLLPTIISQILGTIASGALVRKLRYIPPWAIFGGLLTAVGSGPMTTFTPSTDAGQWIGYQILVGAGRGLALQMPMVAIQEGLPPEDFAIALASMNVSQYLGGSLSVSIAQSIFRNKLLPALVFDAPSVNPQTVIDAGAYGLARVVPPQALAGVVDAYNDALRQTFFLPTATSCLAFFLSFGIGWKKIATKTKGEDDDRPIELADHKRSEQQIANENAVSRGGK